MTKSPVPEEPTVLGVAEPPTDPVRPPSVTDVEGPGLDDNTLVWMAHEGLKDPVLMPRSFLHPSNNADGWSEVTGPASTTT